MIDKAIAEIYTDSLFISICKKYAPGNFEDLRSTVIEMILEMQKEKVKHILENNYLLPYCIRIARNEAVNKYSKFNKQFREIEQCKSIDEIEAIPEDSDHKEILITIDLTEQIVQNKIYADSLSNSNRYFYHSRLIQYWMKYKSTRELSRKTGIPYRSMQIAINDYIEHLKEHVKNA